VQVIQQAMPSGHYQLERTPLPMPPREVGDIATGPEMLGRSEARTGETGTFGEFAQKSHYDIVTPGGYGRWWQRG